MRISIVGPTYPYRGGIAHHTTLLVRHLRAAGHHTKLFSFTRQYPNWLFPGKSDKDPSATPLRVDCEYVLDPINPLTWWSLVRKVRAEHPDILILQWWVPYWTPCLTAISRWIRRNTDIKIIYICHNVVPHDGGGTLDRRLALSVLRQGNAFIVHSEQDRYRLLALLPDAYVIRGQIPHYGEVGEQATGSDGSAKLRASLGLPADVPVLLFFGFVRPYKGLEYLIQALPEVLKQQAVHLLVVGEFWQAPEFYQRYAQEFGVEQAVTLINKYVPDEELRDYFELADVVVLPYISASQSGVGQLAFGFGRPVIATRVGGLHEVVQDGVNGLVVPPQDEHALAQAILRFYQENLGPELTANARLTTQNHLASWERMVQCIEQAAAGPDASHSEPTIPEQ